MATGIANLPGPGLVRCRQIGRIVNTQFGLRAGKVTQTELCCHRVEVLSYTCLPLCVPSESQNSDSSRWTRIAGGSPFQKVGRTLQWPGGLGQKGMEGCDDVTRSAAFEGQRGSEWVATWQPADRRTPNSQRQSSTTPYLIRRPRNCFDRDDSLFLESCRLCDRSSVRGFVERPHSPLARWRIDTAA